MRRTKPPDWKLKMTMGSKMPRGNRQSCRVKAIADTSELNPEHGKVPKIQGKQAVKNKFFGDFDNLRSIVMSKTKPLAPEAGHPCRFRGSWMGSGWFHEGVKMP